MLRALLTLAASALRSTLALFRSREDQAIVELALRQQLAVYVQRHPRPRFSPLDRAFWVALSRRWPQWRSVLVLVQPETVVRWHRKAFRGYWRWISKPGPGRPPIPEETKTLIVRIATENGWRARTIQAELSKLGIRIGLTTIARYLPKAESGKDPHQRWMTFLRNHRDVIAAMDFFVVPTARFTLLYVWFVLDHGRRRILHYNVTTHPTAAWVIQQLRESFPGQTTHRHLVLDNDAIFSRRLRVPSRDSGSTRIERRSRARGRTAPRNASWEACGESCLIMSSSSVRTTCVACSGSTSTSTTTLPKAAPLRERPSFRAKVIAAPRVGGLHHRYSWVEVA